MIQRILHWNGQGKAYRKKSNYVIMSGTSGNPPWKSAVSTIHILECFPKNYIYTIIKVIFEVNTDQYCKSW